MGSIRISGVHTVPAQETPSEWPFAVQETPEILMLPGQEGRMTVPGAGPEQHAGLDVLARSFQRGREGTEQNAAWGNRLGREAQAAERERARARRSGNAKGCRRSHRVSSRKRGWG